MAREIRKEARVPAAVPEVWAAWTTAEGAMTFFAPRARIEARPGGRYELLFNLDAPPGSQGSEGVKVLECRPESRLVFEWNAPPEFPTIRGQLTRVVVELQPAGEHGTLVRLAHGGWQEGAEWDQVYAYFVAAWHIVLGRLQYRFAKGPIDWSNPYRPPLPG
jgi:uncharacterized protein YndB with AHSA1/START domain